MPPRGLLAWLVFICACGLIEQRCGHVEYDFRASKRAGCTRLKHDQNLSCYVPQSGCFEATTLMTLSPRVVSDLAGMGGPLVSWLPILAHRSELPHTADILARTMIWYLAVIGWTRHLHVLTGWDPSGHAIVYGAQLAPLWQIWDIGHAAGRGLPLWQLWDIGPTLNRLWLLVWASLLCYLSGMTAMAFHKLSETAAAAALVLLLAAWLAERHSRRVVERWHVMLAFVSWLVPTALSWISTSSVPTSTALLLGMLVYDLVVWLYFFVALGSEARWELLSS